MMKTIAGTVLLALALAVWPAEARAAHGGGGGASISYHHSGKHHNLNVHYGSSHGHGHHRGSGHSRSYVYVGTSGYCGYPAYGYGYSSVPPYPYPSSYAYTSYPTTVLYGGAYAGERSYYTWYTRQDAEAEARIRALRSGVPAAEVYGTAEPQKTSAAPRVEPRVIADIPAPPSRYATRSPAVKTSAAAGTSSAASQADTGTRDEGNALPTLEQIAVLEGDRHFEKAEYKEAAESFRKAVEANPASRFAWFALANARLALQEFDEAAKAVVAGLRNHPGWVGEQANLADFFPNKDDLEAAVRKLEAQASEKEAANGLKVLLAYVRYFTGKIDEAGETLKGIPNDAGESDAALVLTSAVEAVRAEKNRPKLERWSGRE